MLKALAKDLPIMSDGEIEPGPEWMLFDGKFEAAAKGSRCCEAALLPEPFSKGPLHL